jgi:hypothetical protein
MVCLNNFFLQDVMGVLTGVGQEREVTNQNGSTTKLNVIALEANGYDFKFYNLFAEYLQINLSNVWIFLSFIYTNI